MRKDQRLSGAALKAAATKRARETGFAVVIRQAGNHALQIAPDGSTSVGRSGDYEYCVNFGLSSP